MLNAIKVAAVAMLIAGASSTAFAKTHKVHHRAPGYNSTQQVAPDGFGFGAAQPAYPWLGAPYPADRQAPAEISTYIF
jgi:hypothetical protein